MSKNRDSITFGQYLCQKRKSQGITQKDVAESLGVTTVYICDIEKGKRYPPTKGNQLASLVAILKLNEDEEAIFYDLAGLDKGCVSPDISDYIMSSEIIRSALRMARDKASADDWQHFISVLDKK